MPEKRMLIISPKDNVGVVIEDVKAGDYCVFGSTMVKAVEDIPFPHKIALYDLNEEDHIVKYGEVIGHAIMEISAGSLVHVHNMGCRRGTHDKEGKV